MLWQPVKQEGEPGADRVGGFRSNLDCSEASAVAGDDMKAGDRQLEALGQQAEAGLVRLAGHWRGAYPKLQDAVGFADDPFLGRLRLQVNSKGGEIALLPNQDHYLSRQARSLSEATRNL